MPFNFMAAVTVILDTKKIKSVTPSSISSSICHEVVRLDTMILDFVEFQASFFTLLFHPHQEAL